MNLPRLGLVLLLAAAISSPALATNGDNLIAVGPISRSMGGVGIAAPQDAIGAVFSNPAAMCFGAFCPSNQVDFAGTAFMPSVSNTITSGSQTFTAHSNPKVYPIPALGISFSFPDMPKWRFGFGAYGVSGMGVDYRDRAVDQPNYFMPGAPLAAGTYSDLQRMKFAPTVAFQPTPWLSLGAALHVDYSTLDLGSGSGSGFGVGTQIGAIVKPFQSFSVGLTYTSPQDINYDKVLVGMNGRRRDLTLGSPTKVGLGFAYEPIPKKLLFEADIKWLNWSGASGYGDFDWNNQWVLGLGVQYKPIKKLALRLGYNYGANPVNEHNNFTGYQLTGVQGITMPTYYFETFRVMGFPAIVEHHFTCGLGYEVTDRFVINISYMHAFENSITQRGTNLVGLPTTMNSRMSEDGIDFGFSWRF
jgi:long-chain fatty acid transport protein